MKKLLTLLALCACSLSAFAEQIVVDGIKYDAIKKTKTAEVISGGNYTGDIIIPDSFTYEDVEYNVTGIGFCAFKDCTGLTSVTIPNSVTSIGNYAFQSCRGLTSITIPNSVTSIGYYAFYYCTGFTSVTIPNSVTSIGEHAFSNCSNLTSVTIPNSVTSIEKYAFNECTSLISIIIPNSVKIIKDSSFSLCKKLSSVTIPNSVTIIEKWAFSSCSDLTSVTIPNSVTSIGKSAFSGCSGLTYVTIPNSVTSIGEYAFSSCSGLTSVTIGSGVTSIGSGAIANCEYLEEVNCLAVSVPWTDANAFEKSYIEYSSLHVPAESVDAYKSATPWSGFGTISSLDPAEDIPTCATPTIALVNGKLVVESETPGAENHITVEYECSTKNIDSENSSISLPICKINVSAYATAEGYLASETATASFDYIATQTASGDLNGDGVLTISDVTQLVNTILEQGE